MNLEKAIKVLKKIRERCENHIKTLEENNAILKRTGLDEVLKERRAEFEAIDTILTELQILKKENDTLWEENIKLKQLNIAYKLRINDFAIDIHKAHAEGYQDGFKQAKFEVEMDKIKEGNNEQV